MKTPAFPMVELASGLLAGLAGSFAQSVFFSATKPLAPRGPNNPIEYPEAEQSKETATQTIARRVVEGLAQRPLHDKERAGTLVHYAFGSAWGGLYGLWTDGAARGSILRSGSRFGLLVWMAGDNFVLPVFKLAAWPQAYPLRTHVYAIAAHVAYGTTVAAVHAGLERMPELRRSLRIARVLRPLPRTLRRPVVRGAARVASGIRRGALLAA